MMTTNLITLVIPTLKSMLDVRFNANYTDLTEKNRHLHKYFPIINMCLFMFTGGNSSGIT